MGLESYIGGRCVRERKRKEICKCDCLRGPHPRPPWSTIKGTRCHDYRCRWRAREWRKWKWLQTQWGEQEAGPFGWSQYFLIHEWAGILWFLLSFIPLFRCIYQYCHHFHDTTPHRHTLPRTHTPWSTLCASHSPHTHQHTRSEEHTSELQSR